MDEDGLPLMGSGIDLTKVPAIQQKRTVAFLNQFVVHTVQFLNHFSTVCEEKLSNLSLRIQQIETTLNILDAKLSSIPGLDDVTVEGSPLSAKSVTNGPQSEATREQSQGVPVMAIRNKMVAEGLDPDLLERPDAPVPDGESEKHAEESSESESSFSD
ncbi:WASH complex subunit 3 isoform X3 [Echinops telfairi]|uniref:WASH complex subunit 3 isoform X3 n=1 Tax=Echinops telfairi TaxID=9371 RepID=A0AC55D6J5_ECHTE|nr:WASH complex subunit 3 isoform X3 [Echinops telfairi]